MVDISIILPTFNEAGNIGRLIEAIKKIFNKNKIEFIVVDDNSQDDTQAIVKKLINKNLPIKLIIRKQEKGLATAILSGIKYSHGNFLVLMDTDFNHRPEDVFRLVQAMKTNNADLVVGSRYLPGGGMHQSEASRLQYLLSRWGNFLVNKLLNLPVHESLSGFIAMKKSILSKMNLSRVFTGYGEYCIRLLYSTQRLGFKLQEIPVMYGSRQYGVSKSSLRRMVYFYLKTALELKFQRL